MYTVHFLLYFWTYRPTSEDTTTALGIVDQLMGCDPSGVPEFVRSVLSCHRDFPRHVLEKLSHCLRHDRIEDDTAQMLLSLCAAFMRHEVATISHITLPDGTGLMPSLLISCQRQMCSAPVPNAQLFVSTAVKLMT